MTPLEAKRLILAAQISLKRRLNNEERLAKELGKFFKKLQKEVLKALEEYWSDYQLLQGQINLMVAPVHEAHREYFEILAKYIMKEYKSGQAEAKRLVKNTNKEYANKSIKEMPLKGLIKKTDDGLFGTLAPAERDLLNRTYRTSEQTLSRVDSQLNQIISDGYKSGQGINSIANDLTRRFDQLETWEAKRIARTEVNTSHNTATMDTYTDLGVEYTQWIAASDDRTRDSHVEVDGEIIPIGGQFSNGLSYPGDMSGPIEEWINCRCSVAPFVIPYGYMAPSFSPFREDDLVAVETKPVEEILNPTTEQPIPITEVLPNVENVVGETTSNIPTTVRTKLDEFASATKNRNQEFSQYYTESGKISELNVGRAHKVGTSPKVTDWVNSQAKQGEQFHFVHNHPSSHLNGRTLLSSEDINIFKELKDVQNLQSYTAEGERVRVTIGKLDNYNEFNRSQKNKALSNAMSLTDEGYVHSTKRGTVEYYNEIVENMNAELNKAGMYYRVEERTVESNGEFPKANAVMEKSEIEKLEDKLRQTTDEKERIKILRKLDELSGGFYGY